MSKTATERQRECRQRKRDGENVTSVTTEVKCDIEPVAVGAGVFMPLNTPDVPNMTDDELIRRLHYIKDWQHSPEHKEVIFRRAKVKVELDWWPTSSLTART